MWKIFKESVWGFLLGKVVSVLGVLGTAQTIIALFNPAYVITIADKVTIDYRWWFILTLLLATGVILRVLHTTNRYKLLLETKDKIGIIYSERFHSACREVQDTVEVIRLGVRVIGNTAVENVEVFPKHLYYKSRTGLKQRLINRTALKPMIPSMLSRPVNPGRLATCFVDLIKHKVGTREVSFCYDGFPDKFIEFNAKSYELELEARGKNNQHGYKILFLTFSATNALTVTTKGDDL